MCPITSLLSFKFRFDTFSTFLSADNTRVQQYSILRLSFMANDRHSRATFSFVFGALGNRKILLIFIHIPAVYVSSVWVGMGGRPFFERVHVQASVCLRKRERGWLCVIYSLVIGERKTTSPSAFPFQTDSTLAIKRKENFYMAQAPVSYRLCARVPPDWKPSYSLFLSFAPR